MNAISHIHSTCCIKLLKLQLWLYVWRKYMIHTVPASDWFSGTCYNSVFLAFLALILSCRCESHLNCSRLSLKARVLIMWARNISCLPSQDQTHNPGMCLDWESNLQPFGRQDDAPTTETLGQHAKTFLKSLKRWLVKLRCLWCKESRRERHLRCKISKARIMFMLLPNIHFLPF